MPTTTPIVPADHCVLCELSANDYKTGAYCSLTGQKPRFTKTCDKSKFEGKAAEAIVACNVAHKKLMRSRPTVFGRMLGYLVLGTVVVGAGIFLAQQLWRLGWVENVSWFVAAIGFGLMGVGIRTLVVYRQELEVANTNLNKLNRLLARYGIGYDVEVRIRSAPHDTLDIEHDLRMKKIPRMLDD